MKESVYIRKEFNTLRIGLKHRNGRRKRMPIWLRLRHFENTLYTYMQLVMPLREEWKSSPIGVDPQAVGGGEVWRVFKTKLVIILLRAVWIHIVLLWSSFSEIGEWIKLRITVNQQYIKAMIKGLLELWRLPSCFLVVVVTSLSFYSNISLCCISKT